MFLRVDNSKLFGVVRSVSQKLIESGVAFALEASNTPTLKVPSYWTESPQSSINSIVREYLPLSTFCKLLSVNVGVVAIIELVVPLSNSHL